MPKIYDAIEISLSEPELRQALVAWMSSKTSIYTYNVTDVSVHPRAEYVVRFKVEPKLDSKDEKQLEASEGKDAAR